MQHIYSIQRRRLNTQLKVDAYQSYQRLDKQRQRRTGNKGLEPDEGKLQRSVSIFRVRYLSLFLKGRRDFVFFGLTFQKIGQNGRPGGREAPPKHQF